ncbi:FtsH protease activity modulator HflK [Agaribacter flavus]|uniref:Protein HflK n=1 Tax=Agaribacter flavus TaxID=1902781 RepID=A0ABV7FNC5_9ALTE
MSLLDDFRFISRKYKKFFVTLLVIVVPSLYLLSGFYSVGQEQRAIVTQMGKIVEDKVMPGMHYRLPWPFESVQKISSTSLRSIAIDFSEETEKYIQPELTTGDGDLVNVALEVQYSVSEPGAYYNASLQPEVLLKKIAISETIYYVGSNDVESLLTTGRTRFQNYIKNAIQTHTYRFQLGVRITSIQIKRLEPPPSIKKGFDNVATARSEKQKFIQEAKGERSTRLAQARSEANKTKLEAQAYAKSLTEKALGDHERFLALLEAYKASPSLTAQRQYVNTLEEVLNEVQLSVIKAD